MVSTYEAQKNKDWPLKSCSASSLIETGEATSAAPTTPGVSNTGADRTCRSRCLAPLRKVRWCFYDTLPPKHSRLIKWQHPHRTVRLAPEHEALGPAAAVPSGVGTPVRGRGSACLQSEDCLNGSSARAALCCMVLEALICPFTSSERPTLGVLSCPCQGVAVRGLVSTAETGRARTAPVVLVVQGQSMQQRGTTEASH